MLGPPQERLCLVRICLETLPASRHISDGLWNFFMTWSAGRRWPAGASRTPIHARMVKIIGRTTLTVGLRVSENVKIYYAIFVHFLAIFVWHETSRVTVPTTPIRDYLSPHTCYAKKFVGRILTPTIFYHHHRPHHCPCH
jgi:hypothetical protein